MHNSKITEETREKVKQKMLETLRTTGKTTRFVMADTGTGKTTGFLRALPDILKEFPEARIAIASRTNDEVEENYLSAIGYCGEDLVGLWTQEHCPIKNFANDFPKRMTRIQAGQKQIFIGTHQGILNEERCKNDIGHRDLVLIDEVPKEARSEILNPSSFHTARDIADELGLAGAKIYTETATIVFERQGQVDRSKNVRLNPVKFPKPTGLRDELRLVPDEDSKKLLLPVIQFLEAAYEDRAFERIQRTYNGFRITNTYFSELSSFWDKKIIFSATAHLEGYQIHPNGTRDLDASTRVEVSYANLKVHTVPWPNSVSRWSRTMMNNKKQLELGIQHIMSIVRMTKSDEVLVVCPLGIEEYIIEAIEQEVFTKKVHTCHWGRGVGSNKWKDCGDVILWNNLHKPLDSYVADFHIYSDQLVSRLSLSNYKNGRHLNKAKVIHEGQLYANLKQMANRGRSRQLDDNGVCGEMNLWVSWAHLDPAVLDTIFRGCRFYPVPVVEKRFEAANSSVLERIISGLAEVDEEIMDMSVPELAETLGMTLPNLRNQLVKLFSKDTGRSEAANTTLKLYGWRYIKGQRGGSRTPPRFERLNIAEDDLGDGTFWNPTATSEFKRFNERRAS